MMNDWRSGFTLGLKFMVMTCLFVTIAVAVAFAWSTGMIWIGVFSSIVGLFGVALILAYIARFA